jgi:hypothetical protein
VEGIHPNLAVRYDDPDFYQVMIPAGEELRVKASHSTSDVQVTLYDDQLQAVDSTNLGRVAAYAPGASVPRPAFVGIELSGVFTCSNYDLHIATHPNPQSFQSFCDPAIPNSTGTPTVLHIIEELFRPHTEASVFAYAEFGPPNQFGCLVAGDQVQQLGLPMGAQPICIGGNIGRYNVGGSVLNSIGVFDALGNWTSFSESVAIRISIFSIEFRNAYAIPDQFPNGVGTLRVGQSWGFQLWHRESGGGSSTSNGVLVNW